MFKLSIASTPFTTDAANGYFHNINGEPYGSDNSFLATLRALVAPRIKENESIYLRFGKTNYPKSQMENASNVDLMKALCREYDMNATGQLIIHSLQADADSNLDCLERIKNKFTSVYSDYHRFDKVTAFYRNSFAVDCYVNPENKNVIVFVDRLDNRKLHYLEVSVLVFLPWYLNQEDGLTEDEMALISSLRETSSENYERCLVKLAEQYDFRTARIRQLLSGFESRYERLECEKVKNDIAAFDSRISQLNDQIGEYFAKRNDSCIKLLGLEQKIARGSDEDSEIMEYFMCNNRLVLELVTDTDMYFSVKDHLEYFDKDMAESAINNNHSYVYRWGGSDSARAKMKRFMTEVFLSDDPKLRIRVCAAYRFNLNGSVRGVSGKDFGYEFNGYLPNPHIQNHACMGGYVKTINELLVERNYIGAIEQCIASCKSLNFTDSTVMEEFMKTMWQNPIKCVELPDGNVVSAADAIKWLDQQEGANEQKETEEA